jgi:fibro-slime domain-containing protein
MTPVAADGTPLDPGPGITGEIVTDPVTGEQSIKDPETGELTPLSELPTGGGSGGTSIDRMSGEDGIVVEQGSTIIVEDTVSRPPGCGDGELTDDEACDDGNTTNNDGCNGDCLTVNPGYSCAQPGELCRPIARCGDGLVAPSEQCDDQNVVSGDGCSERCRIEFGKKCEGTPSQCTDTTCGDGVREGAEACDDGNPNPFDGCSSLCLREPNCEGLSCTSDCGDGLVINEECDDGNTIDGDGCSSSCTFENGFTCTQESTCEMVNGECILRVPAIFRDFPGSHPDFGGHNCSEVATGMVEDSLDAAGRPVGTAGINSACVTSAATFAEWYTDSPDNLEVIGDIVLFDNGEGGYVNRFGADGEPYVTTLAGSETGGATASRAACETACNTDAENTTQCSNGNACNQLNGDVNAASDQVTRAENEGADAEEIEELELAVEEAMAAVDQCRVDCAAETDMLTTTCAATCAPCSYDPQSFCRGGTQVEYDGNPAFFPVDDVTGSTNDPGEARLPDQYGHAGWPWEEDVFGTAVNHNFYFTSEVQYWFRYEADTNATLSFLGDDDVWVFVNGELAVDLGGIHVPEEGSVTINAQSAGRFGLTAGNVYKITVFHAERQMEGSSFKLTLSGFEATPSDCVAVCGDGILAFGEECDDGVNDGGYGECEPDCKLGAFCGDGIINGTEDCDNGPGGGAGCPSCRILRVR